MVSYKAVLSKIFTRSPSVNLTDDTSSPYPASPPTRTLSFPTLPSAKFNYEEPTTIPPPRTRRVLVRRPHSTNLGPRNPRGLFSRFRSNSISTTSAALARTEQLFTSSPVTSLTGEDFVVLRPSRPFRHVDPSPTRTTPAIRDSYDIDLLLSNEPGDAKKAIIKRLEGLALALEDVAGTSARMYQKKPSISFNDLPSRVVGVASESLSPIENWEDEDPVGRSNMFASYSHVEDDAGSSSHSRSSSSDSCSSSSISNADDVKPPLTPILTAAQYPISFHLEPIPQLTLDICKSTPSPVYPREISDHTSLLPVENVVVSWDNEQHPP